MLPILNFQLARYLTGFISLFYWIGNSNGSGCKRSRGKQIRVRNGGAYYHVGTSLKRIFQVWFPVKYFQCFPVNNQGQRAHSFKRT